MDPRLRNNETEHSFIGNIPHYWFYDFIFNQANNFSQVEVTINANVPNGNYFAFERQSNLLLNYLVCDVLTGFE